MPGVDQLIQRIRGEFTASQEKLSSARSQQLAAHDAQLKRGERLEQIFDELREIWRPRLEALAKEFGDRIQAAPTVEPGRRQATMKVKSPVATIRLSFTACANQDITQLVLVYDLDILPILMQVERHAELSLPLEEVKPEVIANWLDDRIVSFVKIYLAMHENEYYLRDHMVMDPVAQVRLPKFAAAATRQRGKETLYFISDATAAEYDREHPA